MKKSKAFTLAEVLITLVIIGVIAAMTIPTLMGSTNNQEIKSKVKKTVAAINQALSLEYALYGKNVMTNDVTVSKDELRNMLTNHLSVINEEDNENRTFETADGINFFFWGDDDHVGGLGFVTNGWDKYRDSADCGGLEACKQLNPTVFHLQVWCGSETHHKLCPNTTATYAYVYDMSLEEAYEKSGGDDHWVY